MQNKLSILFILLFATTANSFAQINDTAYSSYYNGYNWVKSTANIIMYNEDCQVTAVDGLSWDFGKNSWKTTSKEFYSYANEGKEIDVIYQSVNLDGSWKNELREVSYYSSTGLLDSAMRQVWNSLTSSWVYQSRSMYTYNLSGVQTSRKTYNYDNTTGWILNEEENTIYDAYNRILKTLYHDVYSHYYFRSEYAYHNDSGTRYTSYLNRQTNKWDTTSRELNDYLGFTNMQETQLSQLRVNNSWQKNTLWNNEYNADSSVTSTLVRSWNETTSNWDNFSKQTWNYYPGNVLKQTTSSIWSAGAWHLGSRVMFTNNGCAAAAALIPVNNKDGIAFNNSPNKFALDVIYDGRPHKLLLVTAPGHTLNSTTKKSSITAATASIKIFPNPARNYFMVDIKDKGTSFITITNLSGKQVLQQSLKNGSQKINISTLAPGFYVVSVTTNGQVINQKLLVE